MRNINKLGELRSRSITQRVLCFGRGISQRQNPCNSLQCFIASGSRSTEHQKMRIREINMECFAALQQRKIALAEREPERGGALARRIYPKPG